jgi:transposase
MIHITKKKKKGKICLYLEQTGRVNGKSKRLWQKYLGPIDKFKDLSKLSINFDIETETMEFGLIASLLLIAKKLDLVAIINTTIHKRNQGLSVGDHILFAAINRCVQPTSKRQLREWFESTVLKRIYKCPDSKLDSRSYWTHFRYISEKNVEMIGAKLARAVHDKFGVNFSDLSFDASNFFTYINPNQPNQTLPNHGHSKDGRSTLNLVNFSLFCALDSGIPLLHLIYPGNEHDAKHFRTALKRLKSHLNDVGLSLKNTTLIFDKGNLSKEAFDFIDGEKYDYIASIRPSTQKEILSIPPEEFERVVLPNGKSLGVKEVRREQYGKERHFIALYNPLQARWLGDNFREKVDNKISKIQEFFKKRLNNKLWSSADKVRNKCLKMLGAKKFRNVVRIDLSGNEGNLTLSVAIDQGAFENKVVTFGKSFLMTSRDDLSARDIAWTYRQQFIVENAFKHLKSPKYLSIRPMYHRVDSSVCGHIFTCFIGLLLLSLLVRELLMKGIPMSIPKAIKYLRSIKLTQISIPGRQVPIIKVDKMSEHAQLLYDTLELKKFIRLR